MEKYASSVNTLPPDRIAGELAKILTGGNVDIAFKLMENTGVLQHVLPEIAKMRGVEHNPKWHPEGCVASHTLKMLGMLKPNCSLTLALGTLFHDVAKPVCAKRNPKTGHNQFFGHETVGARMSEKILRNLRFSNEVVDTVSSHVAQHMKFFNVTKMNESKLKKFVRQENFAELLELNRLDSLGSNGDLTDYNFVTEFLANMTEEQLNPVRLLNGNDLIAMGLKAGPMFKTVLSALEDVQLSGEVTTREEAVFFVEMLTGGNR
jgi:poly(A) polymerase